MNRPPTKHPFTLRVAWLPIALVAGVAQCAHTPPPPCEEPEPITVVLSADARLNQDEKGESLPAVIRVHQLKSMASLETAMLDELTSNEKERLGDDSLESRELTIDPGGAATLAFARKTEAKYVAVLGLYRRPEGLSWRAKAELRPPDTGHCHKPATGGQRLRFKLIENRVENAR